MAKKLSAVPNTEDSPDSVKQNQQKIRVLEKQKKQIKDLEGEADKAVERIQKNLEKTYKFVCALRLDMISDRLEQINPEWARKMDFISDSIEKGEWEGTHA